MDTMTEFLKSRKIRSKKVLALLQKNKSLFLDTVKDGICLTIPSINSGRYVISVDGFDEPFGDEWTEVLSYGGFNLDVKNGLWISDIGSLLEFDSTRFEGDGTEEVSQYGTVHFFSGNVRWNKDRDGNVTYSDYHYDLPDGKYLVKITGYARKNVIDGGANYGYRFTLEKTESFTQALNSREEEYEFNTDWLYTTKTAVIYWLPYKESGIKLPLKDKEPKNSIIIPFENGKKSILVIVFDLTQQTESTTRCRVRTRNWKRPEIIQDFVFESGKEYPICEEIYKRGKTITRPLGTIRID